MRRLLPANVSALYREALATSDRFAFSTVEPREPPASGTAPLSALRSVLQDRQFSVDALREAIRETRVHEEAAIRDKTFTADERAAVISAEIVGVLRSPPDPGTPGASSSARRLVVDVRCLQDPGYRDRGVGRHSEHVLRSLAKEVTSGDDLILFIDPSLGDLGDDLSALGRPVASLDAPETSNVAAFLELSPMTVDPAPVLPLLRAGHVRRAAIVYDFIPNSFPQTYLRTDDRWISYRARLEALDRHDMFLPISESSATILQRVLGRDVSVTVTGVANPLEESPPPRGRPGSSRYAVVPTGADARKNLLVAIAALALHDEEAGGPLKLLVVGSLPEATVREAESFAAACRIPAGRIVFRSELSDTELLAAYAGAAMAIVPSFAEGFSIPVVEAVAAGTPVVASNIGVHAELVGEGWWLVPPDDPVALAGALGRALTDLDVLLERQQRAIGDRFSSGAVAARITRALASLVPPEAPSAAPGRPRRAGAPRLAVLTPLPPQQTGVGHYSAHTFAAVAHHAEVTFYTDPSVAASGDTERVRPYSVDPYAAPGYDAVVSILGNSPFHIPPLEYLLRFGGAAVAHDAQMADLYNYWQGPDRLARLLSRRSRAVRAQDVVALLREPERLDSTTFDEIASRARPLFVHSENLARRLRDETGAEAVVLPYVPHRRPSMSSVDEAAVREARRSLGWPEHERHVVSFGIVDRRTKATTLIVEAVVLLRNTGHDLRLHFVGSASDAEREVLLRLASSLGIEERVHITGWQPSEALETYLLAADTAIQLRAAGLSPLSGALLDCVAFGVPTIATRSIAEEIGAPAYVRRIDQQPTAGDVAEALAGTLASRRDAAQIEESRRAWLEQRSAEVYAERLLRGLGFPL